MAHLDHLIMVGAVVVIAGCAGRAPSTAPSPSCAIGDTALVLGVRRGDDRAPVVQRYGECATEFL